MKTIGVIGGGLAGLMAARVLADRGLRPLVFDKGRAPGGRATTRKRGALELDHGAQFFTRRSVEMLSLVSDWVERGVAARWDGRLVRIDEAGRLEPAKEAERFVGVPAMGTLALDLASSVDVRTSSRIERLVLRRDGRWEVVEDPTRTSGGSGGGPFDQLIVALPPAQAAPLLAGIVPKLASTAASAKLDPCWAVMATFDAPVGLPFDGAFVASGPVSWLARNSSKPGRPAGETWVLHAGAAWSSLHLEVEPADAGQLLLEAAGLIWPELANARDVTAHRWRYALAPAEAPSGPLFDEAKGVALAGDWTVGGRVEGALLSGWRAAHALLTA